MLWILLGAPSEIYSCASNLETKLFPRLAPPKCKRKLDPPWKLSCFFGDKPIEPRSWFQKSFSQVNTQMSQPLLNMKGLPHKMQNWKIIFRDNSILNLKLTFFPYWFLLAHRAQKTGGARATTSLLLWGKRKGIEKTIPTSFFVLLGWWPPRWRQQPLTFLFRVSPGT